MDPFSITTFGLQALLNLGVSNAVVFSPVLLYLASNNGTSLAGYKLPNGWNPNFEEMNGFIINNSSYTALWQYPYLASSSRMKFCVPSWISERICTVNEFNYVFDDLDQNEELLLKDEGFRVNQDYVFNVLEIPLRDSNRFIIFLPNLNYTIGESLKEFTFSRIQSLLADLSLQIVDFEIPYFKTISTINTARLLRLPTRKYHRFSFDYTLEGVHIQSILTRPFTRQPYPFIVNRPFFYAVFDNNVPIVMGVFTGRERS